MTCIPSVTFGEGVGVGRWVQRRVPMRLLGAYATIGRMDGWGIYPDERYIGPDRQRNYDLDALVTLETPFSGLCFDSCKSDEIREQAMTHAACHRLRCRDSEIYKDVPLSPNARWSDADRERHLQQAQESIQRRRQTRAGAAHWLFERDKLRLSFPCSGAAEGYTFSPLCKGYNADAAEFHLDVGSRTGQELHISVAVHVLLHGQFVMPANIWLEVPHRTKRQVVTGTFCRPFAGVADDVRLALRDDLTRLAKQMAIQSREREVARAQAAVDELRVTLGEEVQPCSG